MKKLLVIGNNWPEPTTTAAGSRMLQLLKIFQHDGYEVHFACAAAKSPYSIEFDALKVKEQYITLNDSSFDLYVKSLQPDIVLYDRFMIEEQYGWRVRENVPAAKNILDTEDLHFLRKAREEALKKNIEVDLFNETAMREIAAILRCDLSLIISKVEFDILQNTFQIDRSQLFHLPFLISDQEIIKFYNTVPYKERAHFVMIGNSMHKPNYDAILFMKNEIWPEIRIKAPEVELHIYGAYQNQKILQLNNQQSGFLVKGHAQDAVTTLKKYRLLLAPLRFGAGQKGKVFDAMKAATPAAMTTIAAESMFDNTEVFGFIDDDPINYAHRCLQLYKSEEKWQSSNSKNIDILKSNYMFSAFAKAFSAKISSLFSYKSSKSKSDLFAINMLNYHTHKANKYMSKWIEEKNS